MLSWNAGQFTRIAVDSIRAVTRYPYEIVIVDNGSDEATHAVLEGLAADGDDVRIVYNGRNLGFGGGMNVGMRHARGDVVVLLNNDVVVTQGWLEDMVGASAALRRARRFAVRLQLSCVRRFPGRSAGSLASHESWDAA